jgi:SAM-dependent methyltransferase
MLNATYPMEFQSLLRRRLFGARWRWERLNNRLFDYYYGTQTHQEASLTTSGVAADQARKGNDIYRPFWRREFFQSIADAGIRTEKFVFIDIGSGKGKLLLLAAQLDFADIIGVEYAPKLHEVAVDNIDRFKKRSGSLKAIVNVNANALAWPLPRRPALFFMYNPFDLLTTQAFFSRLDEHAAQSGAPTVLIYGNLRGVNERAEAFQSAKTLMPKVTKPRYTIFASF